MITIKRREQSGEKIYEKKRRRKGVRVFTLRRSSVFRGSPLNRKRDYLVFFDRRNYALSNYLSFRGSDFRLSDYTSSYSHPLWDSLVEDSCIGDCVRFSQYRCYRGGAHWARSRLLGTITNLLSSHESTARRTTAPNIYRALVSLGLVSSVHCTRYT